MDPFAWLLDQWFRQYYEETCRRVTSRCAAGDVHRAEEAIQTVLRRMLEYRDRRDPQGQSYCTRVRSQHGQIVINLDNNEVPLTTYIIAGACRQLRRPERMHQDLPIDNLIMSGPKEAEPQTDFGAVVTLLLPCLTRLTYVQFVALVLRLLERHPVLQAHLGGYVGDSGIAYWRDRVESTQAGDLFRARQNLVACLWKEGIASSVLVELL